MTTPIVNQRASLSGTALSFTAAAVAGDSAVAASTNQFLIFKNGSGSPETVTIASPVPSNYGGIENLVVAVAGGAEVIIGPLPPSRFASTAGMIAWTYSDVTSLTVASVLV